MASQSSKVYERPFERSYNNISEVTKIYHATHIHTAVEMLKRVEWNGSDAECEVEITAFPNNKMQQLIFFGCPLGQAWKENRKDEHDDNEDRSRYGNVVFEFDLNHVLEAYAELFNLDSQAYTEIVDPDFRASTRLPNAGIAFLAGGTKGYQVEISHKVFVAHRSQAASLGYPLLNNQEPDLPLTIDQNGKWWVSDIGKRESMEFVLYFGTALPSQKPPSITFRGKMKFNSHRDICVPLTKMENRLAKAYLSEQFFLDSEDFPCRVSCNNSGYVHRERAKTKQAITEFAAAILWFERRDLYSFLHAAGLIKLLADSMKKIAKRNSSEQVMDPTKYQKKYYPKHWYANRLYEKYCLHLNPVYLNPDDLNPDNLNPGSLNPDSLQGILETLCNPVLSAVRIDEEQLVEQEAEALVLQSMDLCLLHLPNILQSLCNRMSRFPNKRYKTREEHPGFVAGRDSPKTWYTYACYEIYCRLQPEGNWHQILSTVREEMMPMLFASIENAEDQSLAISAASLNLNEDDSATFVEPQQMTFFPGPNENL